MKFKNVTEMIRRMSNQDFYFAFLRHKLFWLNNYNHVIDKDLWLSVYQNEVRIYLDEYPEQQELREEYSAKRFIESIIKENPSTCRQEVETDNFFYERFMRRK